MREHLIEQAQAILIDKELSEETMESMIVGMFLSNEEDEFLAEWLRGQIEVINANIARMDKEIDELSAECFLLQDEIRHKKELLNERRKSES